MKPALPSSCGGIKAEVETAVADISHQDTPKKSVKGPENAVF